MRELLHQAMEFQHTPGIAVALVGATALALAQTEAVAIGAHGNTSHKANGESKFLRRMNDRLMWLLSVDRVSWSSAHVGDVEIPANVSFVDDLPEELETVNEGIEHHGFTDGSIAHCTRVELYLRACEADPEKYKDHRKLDPNEKEIPNLDPSAKYTYAEVRALGSFGIEVARAVLQDKYAPPESYTKDEGEKVLDFSVPRYGYSNFERKSKNDDYTFDEQLDILLSGPYEPALVVPGIKKNGGLLKWIKHEKEIRNGGYGVYKYNVNLFRKPADYYRRNPEQLRPMLKDEIITSPDNKRGLFAIYGAAILGMVGFNVAKDGFKATSLVAGLVEGASMATAGVVAPVYGGKIVNGMGHLGEVTPTELIKALFNRPLDLKPNKDGSYMTTIVAKGMISRALMKTIGAFFWGELEGQPAHHKSPGNRHYAFKKGIRGFLEEPITASVKWLSNRKHFRFGLRPGEGFSIQFGRRPDDLNSAMKNVVQPARVRTLNPDLYRERLEKGEYSTLEHRKAA